MLGLKLTMISGVISLLLTLIFKRMMNRVHSKEIKDVPNSVMVIGALLLLSYIISSVGVFYSATYILFFR